jgi:hypothetical protein
LRQEIAAQGRANTVLLDKLKDNDQEIGRLNERLADSETRGLALLKARDETIAELTAAGGALAEIARLTKALADAEWRLEVADAEWRGRANAMPPPRPPSLVFPLRVASLEATHPLFATAVIETTPEGARWLARWMQARGEARQAEVGEVKP